MRFVYFARASADGAPAIKIGVAGNPRRRIRELQCGSPTRIDLVAFVPGDEALERRLHETFTPVALHGEWFAEVGKLRDFIGYLEGYADEGDDGRQVTREQFETSIADNVANDSWTPVHPETEEQFEASANRSLWAEFE